jgi:hypothetical protein
MGVALFSPLMLKVSMDEEVLGNEAGARGV